MKKLGILGGLGPMATAYFLQLLTQMTDAGRDQEHMEILLYSKPSIPDRTSYIIGKSQENPVSEMVAVGRKLKEMGAEILAIPCITAHFFHKELEEQIGLPILHAVEETAAYLKETIKTNDCLGEKDIPDTDICPEIPSATGKLSMRVGILATDGTIQSGLFQDALSRRSIQPLMPGPENQKNLMDIIYNEIKTGKKVNMPLFLQITKELTDQGAQVILLGCTELSLIKKDYDLPPGYLDVLEVLARKTVLDCSRLKREYVHLQ